MKHTNRMSACSCFTLYHSKRDVLPFCLLVPMSCSRARRDLIFCRVPVPQSCSFILSRLPHCSWLWHWSGVLVQSAQNRPLHETRQMQQLSCEIATTRQKRKGKKKKKKKKEKKAEPVHIRHVIFRLQYGWTQGRNLACGGKWRECLYWQRHSPPEIMGSHHFK